MDTHTATSRSCVPGQREERHIAGEDDDVELVSERQRDEVGFQPGPVGREPTRFRDHRRIDIDPDDVDAVPGELDRDAAGTQPASSTDRGLQGTDEGRFAVDVDTLRRGRVEPGLVVAALEASHRAPVTAGSAGRVCQTER